ncbi:hypothetical protein [Ructibacterium gallinarum]|uniref:Uncharacterized protein n=1 Tax=Ructibacterium gallinarum TaxID=2779355 RepID=A0A9D5LZ63_9FIRM|nr:hypothetical protein [Ructibacterium gallinarum]MBE5040741.1 hypothetical protein [Ructibacterium gallinarum]
MQKLALKGKMALYNFGKRTRQIMQNDDGDQITGWLIVILLVVVVGAFFLKTYQGTIVEIWEAIVDKIYATFGI